MTLDPFRLFGRFLLALFKIGGYFLAYGLQVIWYIGHSRREHVGDAIGEFGHAVTDAIAEVFRD